jgi:GNAT superfamily N-acetyltransferase
MINLRLMTGADVPLGLRLCGQAGWNQTEADWRRALDLQPDGCFVAEWDGTPVGTTTTCIFGDVAWIAMVLVDPALRGHGIGTALLRHALAFLDGQGIATVRLDATPLGEPLYERLGFVAEYRVARYEGSLSASAALSGIEHAVPGQWEALAALDRAVMGVDRQALLYELFAAEPERVRMMRQDGAVSGFIAARTGKRAVHLGPCIAPPEVSPLLLVDAWGRCPGQHVYVDIPVENMTATRLAEAQGLIIQRYLTRMRRGAPRSERLDWIAATFGPEKG